jgi:Uma2 family endonuclease
MAYCIDLLPVCETSQSRIPTSCAQLPMMEKNRQCAALFMPVVTLNIDILKLTDAQFSQLCQLNDGFRLERTAQGEIVMWPPVDDPGRRSQDFFWNELQLWNQTHSLGELCTAATLFRLPNGALRSPDMAWVERSRWTALAQSGDGILSITPDFIIEVCAAPEELDLLQAKMQEYQDAQIPLGWLVNFFNQQVEIYRTNHSKDVLSLPAMLSGESVLPGFVLTVMPR